MKRGDRVFTPDWCARDMVAHFRPSGIILEPAAGDGAILAHLPPETLTCEIDQGSNFFAFDGKVDWIITNPPYSKTRPFFNKAATVARDIVFLVPARNIVSGYGFVRDIHLWGGTVAIRWYGTGNSLGFPMGNAIAAFHWRRDYAGPTQQSFYQMEDASLFGVAA